MAETTAQPDATPAVEAEAPVGKHWSDWVALITAVLAVVTAFASAEASNLSSQEILLQNQETDRWGLFQAESLKAHTYSIESDLIDLLPADPALQAKRDAAKQKYKEGEAKYLAEKNKAQADAKDLARQRQEIDLRGTRETHSVIFLQIAIVLCSVAGLTKKRWLLAAGLISGLSGVLYFAAAAFAG
jgi:hypothetical protein